MFRVPVESPPSYHPKIRVERDGHLTTVTIDSPKAKNACTGDMFVALGRVFRDVSFSGTRVVVLTGAEENFCSGADLSGGNEPSLSQPSRSNLGGMRVLGEVVLAIHSCPIPVVA